MQPHKQFLCKENTYTPTDKFINNIFFEFQTEDLNNCFDRKNWTQYCVFVFVFCIEFTDISKIGKEQIIAKVIEPLFPI